VKYLFQKNSTVIIVKLFAYILIGLQHPSALLSEKNRAMKES